MTSMRIGFIGLGRMGANMVRRLGKVLAIEADSMGPAADR